jgi:hypothetical protein
VEQWKVAGVVEEMVAGPVRRRWDGGSRQIIIPTQYYNCLHVTSVERESSAYPARLVALQCTVTRLWVFAVVMISWEVSWSEITIVPPLLPV